MNNTFDEKSLSIEANKLKEGKGTVAFEPICIFTENKPRRAFYRGARRFVFYVDGAVKALRFRETTDELQTAWTKKEAQEFVDAEIAKAHQKLKQIKTWQFIVIMALLVVIVLLQLNTGGYVRFGR